jgi:2-oxoglutarate dehydrogenase E1 component
MTPKSLLRHPLCVSKLEDFTKGGFKEVIDDTFVDTKKSKTS